VWPANSPIIVFFDDIIYLGSIENNFEIKIGGNKAYGNVNISSTINENGDPIAVLTFTPYKPFDINKEVTITIKKDLQDKCGNKMSADLTITFTAQKSTTNEFSFSNWGFEAGNAGVEFTGDGAIIEANGTLVPHGGKKLAAISSGNELLSKETAIAYKSSFLKLGPINTEFNKLNLWFDFISAEFNDYVGTIYNDEAVITIYGPNGTVSKSLTSVNTLGDQPNGYTGNLNMPDMGDSFAGQMGWQKFVLDGISVGTPAYIIFTVSDIGDTIYSTILAVDDITLQ
jgi:hypothetical protein